MHLQTTTLLLAALSATTSANIYNYDANAASPDEAVIPATTSEPLAPPPTITDQFSVTIPTELLSSTSTSSSSAPSSKSTSESGLFSFSVSFSSATGSASRSESASASPTETQSTGAAAPAGMSGAQKVLGAAGVVVAGVMFG